MTDDSGVVELREQAEELYLNGEYAAAFRKAEELLRVGSGSAAAMCWAGALMIDIGGAALDSRMARRGIEATQRVLDEHSDAIEPGARASLLYNLSNGHAALASCAQRQGDRESADAEVSAQKNLLQEVLLDRTNIRPAELPSVLTNYADILRQRGRLIEAIDYYSEANSVAPTHAVAQAGKGLALWWFAAATTRQRAWNFYHALETLRSACAKSDRIRELGGPETVADFRQQLDKLESLINDWFSGGAQTLHDHAEHRYEAHSDPPASQWGARLVRERLLLTLNQEPLCSEDDARDDLFFRGVVEPITNGEARVREWVNTFNALKEEYATARYLWLHTEQAEREIRSCSRVTLYGDVFEYREFGLVPGLRKGALRLAVDCHDKIARLLNSYLGLQHPVESVNFSNLWFAEGNWKKGPYPKLAQIEKNNVFLRALKELYTDLHAGQFPGPLKGVRDQSTHQGLFVYFSGHHPGSSDESTLELDSSTLNDYCRFALRHAKAAIVYASCLIDFEEAQARGDEQRLQLPIRLGESYGDADW